MDKEDIEEAIEVLEDASAQMLMETGDENYYSEAINALRQALKTEQEPVISTDHGPWIPSTHPREEGETYCKRCLLRDKFFGSRKCDPHIVYRDPPQRKPQALAQPEQEPVAWVCYGMSSDEKHCVDYEQSDIDAIPVGTMLYTAPLKREWVGLTDEERHSIREWRGIQKELGPVWAPMLLYLYEAIEAKLKEKNT